MTSKPNTLWPLKGFGPAALSGWGLRLGRPPLRRLEVVWALFTGSIFCFALYTLAGVSLGALAPMMSIVGSASCGWSWLLARALFRPAEAQGVWPDTIVGSLLATGAVVVFAQQFSVNPASAGGAVRIFQNAHALTGSTVLLLTLIEPLRGHTAQEPKRERLFRIAFVGVYGALMTVAVLWADQAPSEALAARWGDALKVASGLIGVAAATLAVLERSAHPLPAKLLKRGATPPGDAALAAKIMRVLKDDGGYARSGLKVADLARLVRRPDYKVTQCITGTLGFNNFNQLMNHLRIEQAKALLDEPEHNNDSILTIALECGFGSLGPFNRAFKAAVDMTPTEYRAAGQNRAQP